MSADRTSLTVAVCTRKRPERLRATLDALERQSERGFELLVVDQSRSPDPELERRAAEGRLAVVHDEGTGLSRARNLAARRAGTEWIAFVDDDCVVDDDFAASLRAELDAHPEADWVSGDVRPGGPPIDGLPVTTFPVRQPRHVSGRRVLPGRIGFGVLFCVRRAVVERLGGWDERLGPGASDFPAADDMDFNWRLLRSGGVAYLSPRVRAVHDQWRPAEELAPLNRGYSAAWAGFCVKQMRLGDLAGGLWLWAWGAVDVLDMLASAIRRRSRLRLRLALAKLRGLTEGTLRAAARSW